MFTLERVGTVQVRTTKLYTRAVPSCLWQWRTQMLPALCWRFVAMSKAFHSHLILGTFFPFWAACMNEPCTNFLSQTFRILITMNFMNHSERCMTHKYRPKVCPTWYTLHSEHYYNCFLIRIQVCSIDFSFHPNLSTRICILFWLRYVRVLFFCFDSFRYAGMFSVHRIRFRLVIQFSIRFFY